MYRFFYLPVFYAILSLAACSEPAEMAIDPYLKEHSKRFNVKEKQGAEFQLEIGQFTAYDKIFGLGWMDAAGIMEFFNESSTQTFSTDNNDNYTYNHVIAESRDAELIHKYASKFNLPLDTSLNFKSAYVGYMYAPHDEYSMVFIRNEQDEITGLLSNGFDTYEILPVLHEGDSPDSQNNILGYQFKLYEEYVGSLQTSESKVFRMTTEYCDATEVILAGIASTLIKIEKS